MQNDVRTEITALRKEVRVVRMVLIVELIAAAVLVFYIGAVYDKAKSSILLCFVATLLQPETQLGLVGNWHNILKGMETAAEEVLPERLALLETQRKEGLGRLMMFLIASPIVILLELGTEETAYTAPGVVFGLVSFAIFAVWGRSYRKKLAGLAALL